MRLISRFMAGHKGRLLVVACIEHERSPVAKIGGEESIVFGLRWVDGVPCQKRGRICRERFNLPRFSHESNFVTLPPFRHTPSGLGGILGRCKGVCRKWRSKRVFTPPRARFCWVLSDTHAANGDEVG